jgi:hypothetical protein
VQVGCYAWKVLHDQVHVETVSGVLHLALQSTTLGSIQNHIFNISGLVWFDKSDPRHCSSSSGSTSRRKAQLG